MEFLRGNTSFIMQPSLDGQKNSVGIFDLNKKLLASYSHDHTWRSPRAPFKMNTQARSTNIYLENIDGTLIGEINEIPPRLFSMKLVRTFELYDQNKILVGL